MVYVKRTLTAALLLSSTYAVAADAPAAPTLSPNDLFAAISAGTPITTANLLASAGLPDFVPSLPGNGGGAGGGGLTASPN
ncbi:hypothetical protein OAG1_13540 [Agarivorans sp. OAG1]|uniref:Uncharacterized protein n=1 Tax=Agarivorans albus MKT 106 TaxID=1331007 RepID=R9PM38_AGAAL|nr:MULTISPECIES: hypothetical protein [Agarivorans]MPW28938.1 hypothetical protein [Agarivorans sp. B2Z047]UQN41495.1 hypothetical protein LQZ07_17185 [Agarivorans sp. B2Z047]BEU02554.1 hypothetical protein OAG1_13540 [Agarivorans sp. OAG1]GAD02447.1 hypothetical protein AALB_2527 [Agarivorans albus MKT 106]